MRQFSRFSIRLARGLMVLVLLLTLMWPMTALADTIVNDVTAVGNDTINQGGSTTINYWISPSDASDPLNGCNANTTDTVTVELSVPSGVTALPSSLVFTGCGDGNSQSVTFGSNTAGDYTISVASATGGRTHPNGTQGTFNTSGATFTLHVLAPADTTAPVITADLAGTMGNNGWYVSDVTVSWNVSDPESGIASSSGCDTTTLNTDTAGTTLTCSATNGAGLSSSSSVTIKIDKTMPVINISAPADGGEYLLNQVVAADYGCSDALSDIATCSGSVASGANFDTGSIGTKTFTVTATDNAGNSVSKTVTYNVTYSYRLLYDPTKSWKLGSTIPIKMQLVDANGVNQSSSTINVKASALTLISTSTSGTVEDSGNANPSDNFRYDSTLQGYIFNLSTKGLSTGTWDLGFTVSGDPVTYHSLQFGIK